MESGRARRRALAVTACAVAPVLSLACASTAPTAPTAPSLPGPSAPLAAPAPEAKGAAPAEGAPALSAVDESALDRTVAPCDDFYAFACGGFRKATTIPDDEASWTRSFSVIHEANEAKLKDLLEGYARGESPSDPYASSLGSFYASCIDEAAIEKAGLAPLAPVLAKVSTVKDAKSFTDVAASLAAMGVRAPFLMESGQDMKDATSVIADLGQGGLGLPEREYYLSDNAKKKELRAKYEAHVARMFVLLGDAPTAAKAHAATVMRVETALARASTKKEDLRDPAKIYHRVDRQGLKKLAPALDWDAFMKAVGVPAGTAVNVSTPGFFKALSAMVGTVPMADWQTYLRWHVTSHFADQLPVSFQNERFEMTRALRGTASIPPRWKRCVRAVDAGMGEALGQAFVKATLGSEGKESVRTMIGAIEREMEKNLKDSEWMDETTRGRALAKLSAIANKVAFPDKWRDYSKLQVSRDSFLGNVARAAEFEHARSIAKIGKPVDKAEWEMSPPTVNAYYNPQMNEMVFPAGILQRPFYGNHQAMATNFGGIGMVMGHELTHGFDDEGRKFDAQGNMQDWWTKPVDAEFEKKAACVEKQYDEYTVPGGDHVNGKLTLGENIADLGGVKLAYSAMKATLAKGAFAKVGDFTPEQQFFLGFAQGWCTVERDEYLRLLVATNPHSPPRYRVQGPLSNLKEFATAFQCKAGDKMVRSEKDRCEVW